MIAFLMRLWIPWAAVILVLSAFTVVSCSAIDPVSRGIDKIEAARTAERARKPPKPGGRRDQASPLQAYPSTVDFGQITVAGTGHRTVTITSPFSFPVTIADVVVQGEGFGLDSGSSGPRTITPFGQVAIDVIFHPTAKIRSSGRLIVELDTAGDRFTRVSLRGDGR